MKDSSPVTNSVEVVERVVVLCGNRNECVHYMEQYLTKPGNEEKKIRASHPYTEVENDTDKVNIRWITPDDVMHILGTEVHGVTSAGTAYEHRNYHEAFEYIQSRIRPFTRSATESTSPPNKTGDKS